MALLVDTSVYVVLSTTYLQNQLGFGDTTYYLICWAIILLFTLVNILGVKIVALRSSLFSLFIIAPFIVLGVLGLMNWQFLSLIHI